MRWPHLSLGPVGKPNLEQSHLVGVEYQDGDFKHRTEVEIIRVLVEVRRGQRQSHFTFGARGCSEDQMNEVFTGDRVDLGHDA
jgi:hypothetical protein